MFKKFLVCFLLILCCSLLPAFAQGENSEPDKNGNYSTMCFCTTWEVVDPDPAGLNGRLDTGFYKEWYAPCAEWNEMNIGEWPVIRTFSKGTILIANGTPAGFIGTYDDNGNPWMKVTIGPDDEICFVRANSKYIKPVELTERIFPITYSTAVINDPDGYTNIRAGKGSESEIIDRAEWGEFFAVISAESEWWKVLSPSGKIGFMHYSRVTIVKDNVIGAGKVISKTPLRKGPSPDYGVIKDIPADTTLFLFSYTVDEFEILRNEEVGPWAKVLTPGGDEGYINTEDLLWIALPDK